MVALVAGPLDPGPALAHLVPGRPARPRRSARVRRRAPGARSPRRPATSAHFTNWNTPIGQPCVPGPQRQPERGRRLALARAGVDGQQRPAAALPGGQPVVGDRAPACPAASGRPPRVRAGAGRRRTARRAGCGRRRGAPASAPGQAEPDRAGLAVDDDARRRAGQERRRARVSGSAPRGGAAVGDDDEQRPAARVAQALDGAASRGPAAARRPAGCGHRCAAREPGHRRPRGWTSAAAPGRRSAPRNVIMPTLSRRW